MIEKYAFPTSLSIHTTSYLQGLSPLPRPTGAWNTDGGKSGLQEEGSCQRARVKFPSQPLADF